MIFRMKYPDNQHRTFKIFSNFASSDNIALSEDEL